MRDDTKPKKKILLATIENIDQEGRGVTHVEGKAIFVEGALQGEIVECESYVRKSTYEIAFIKRVIKQSNLRVKPKCDHFNLCGGCSMQHFEFQAQIAAKQRVFENTLSRIGKVKPETLLTPLAGPSWNYRYKGRLRVKFVVKKNKALVGFNEKRTHFIADISSCEVLPKNLSDILPKLKDLITQLSIKDKIPQIEFAADQNHLVLVLRILDVLNVNDEALLNTFSSQHPVQFWTQSKGPDTIKPLSKKDDVKLSYTLKEFELQFNFMPYDFTQINPFINQVLVRRAMSLLKPSKDDQIFDFFCGLGNFTLPIATFGAKVTGIEGSVSLLERAKQCRDENHLDDLVDYQCINLFEITKELLLKLGKANKWLIDPPRDGAFQLLQLIDDEINPLAIVYVSCNPATLARDAQILVNEKGYKFDKAGIVNMFPHTSHVESVALFLKTES
ncbi:MAG: 23S rRNA (uracil(1939)-C(5))-methyltransferase RlmD [Candidatus Methylopumilus sp.]|nr:23S rRNA (uracil(1939)-C(5))-methyltransferase RlmD [Candidatus Methylopumilus sp.]